jgi:hypothetical protein
MPFTCPHCFVQVPDEVADDLLKLDDKVTTHEQKSAACPSCGKVFRRVVKGTIPGPEPLVCNGDVPCSPWDEKQMVKNKEWKTGVGTVTA